MPFFEAALRTGGDLKRSLLNLLFPPRCVVCGHPGTWLCAKCAPHLPRISGPVCDRCGIPLQQGSLCGRCRYNPPRLDGIRSVFLFRGPIRTAIHRLKYRNARGLAEPLGMSMAAQWEQCAVKVDLVAPVPLHANRLRQRGYNQAALLANELEQHTGLPLRKDLMVRVRPTPPQMRLDARARRRNVHGAFICPDELVEGRRVLVVDDVCTTGATLEACANALREKGATAIWALTAARAP